jgi:hypothetical protein
MKSLLLIIIMIFTSNKINSQSYPVTINKIRFLSGIYDGNDITTALKNIIANCNDGDVIVIPKGKFIVSGQIDIANKEISIIGNGSDPETGTELFRSDKIGLTDFSNIFKFYKETSSIQFKTFISGIYFKSIPSIRYSSTASVPYADQCIEYVKNTNFIVTDNVFQYFGGAGIVAFHKDSIEDFNGLIFNNEFLDFYRPELANYGYGVLVGVNYNENKKWISSAEFGSNKFLFIENNYFRETRHAVASASNAKYVFRYNIVDNNWVARAIDMHGAGNFGNEYSSRASESYGNVITNHFDFNGEPISESIPWNEYSEAAIGIRGGEALIYNNKGENYKNFALFLLENPNPGTYPSPFQIGYLSGLKYGANDFSYYGDHAQGDAFLWNNTFDKRFPEWNLYKISPADTSLLKFGRDIQLDISKNGYTSYIYPHDFRNYYYSFIDTFINKITIVSSAKISDTSVQLEWNNVLCEDGYIVYKSTDGTSFSIFDTTKINDTSIVIPSLDPKSQYWFLVKAYNDNHEGSKSQIVTINEPEFTSLFVYPNPSDGKFGFCFKDTNQKPIKLVITDLLGRIIHTEQIKTISSELMQYVDVSFIHKGIYVLILESGGKKTCQQILIN